MARRDGMRRLELIFLLSASGVGYCPSAVARRDGAIAEATKRGRTASALNIIEAQCKARGELVGERQREAGGPLAALKTERASVADGDESAEPVAEHVDRPQPQCATDGEKNDAKPADGVAIDRPEVDPVIVGRQLSGQQSDYRKGGDDPAVAAILTDPRADVSAREEGNASHYEEYDRERDQGRTRKKRCRPAPSP
jgi:hypothetical protein